ncbi:MAG TPA: DUF1634 domain-containing protein [Candidatus Angelobacter sp.]|nr:DUF1634 domain-containing protein [Candidatus Angelobacter sp.]
MQARNRWTDYELEQIIGNLLRAGVILAAFVVLVGGVFYLFQHGTGRPDYHTFHEPSSDMRSVKGVLRDALALHSRGIIQFGLLLLVLTPVSRVAFSALGFWAEGDRMYVVITLIVLAVLLFSLLGAK